MPTAARKATVSKFSVATFEALANDLKSRRIPLPRMTVSDNVQVGLRVNIRDTGMITFHVQYEIEDKKGNKSRPYRAIGHHPDMSIAEARTLAKTIIALAGKGVDPFGDMDKRIIHELKRDGERWRP